LRPTYDYLKKILSASLFSSFLFFSLFFLSSSTPSPQNNNTLQPFPPFHCTLATHATSLLLLRPLNNNLISFHPSFLPSIPTPFLLITLPTLDPAASTSWHLAALHLFDFFYKQKVQQHTGSSTTIPFVYFVLRPNPHSHSHSEKKSKSKPQMTVHQPTPVVLPASNNNHSPALPTITPTCRDPISLPPGKLLFFIFLTFLFFFFFL
jgi:hypothetical protein